MSAAPSRRRAEAKTIADRIIRSASDLYLALLEFAKIRGWQELGYASFGAWADENMPVTRWVAYQELARAQVLDKIATALHLPMAEVTAAASALPQREAAAVAGLVAADDEVIEGIVVSERDPVAVMEQVRAVAGRNIVADPATAVRQWAARCRKLSYPDSIDRETAEVLIEAGLFIQDCLGSWEKEEQ